MSRDQLGIRGRPHGPDPERHRPGTPVIEPSSPGQREDKTPLSGTASVALR